MEENSVALGEKTIAGLSWFNVDNTVNVMELKVWTQEVEVLIYRTRNTHM